jgi:ethanolamine utilization protein EutQ (cupin superfamily)
VLQYAMGSFHPGMQKARFADIESDVHGLISKKTAELDGVAVTEVTFGKGARWSNDLKEYAGTDLCQLPHVAVVISGALGVRMTDGSEDVFSAGDVMLLPPGHDAWSVGDEACTFVEFSRGGDYYAS